MLFITQDLIRDELQHSFKQRAEHTVQRKQQELEEQLFRRTMDAVQEVDIDSQRVIKKFTPGCDWFNSRGTWKTGTRFPSSSHVILSSVFIYSDSHSQI